MSQLTNEQIFEKYKGLPKELQNAITSIDTADIVQAIGKKYGLQIDKMGELDDETGLLMLGVTHPRDFISNLTGRLGTDPETTKKIAQEINAQIFSKVKESLKKIHAVGEEVISETPTAPTPFVPPVSPVAPISHVPAVPPEKSVETETQTPNREIKGTEEFKSLKTSPFETRLEEKVFMPGESLSEETEQARKENRYPDKADPYKEPPK
ncbi:MAG: hypothetical protein HYY55_03070 [Candidatus Niyogibacteria bacterium]|nr:MAG: hypothetical protein HYY55_03070 [Candidatus Niyogibacteria bacterium]